MKLAQGMMKTQRGGFTQRGENTEKIMFSTGTNFAKGVL